LLAATERAGRDYLREPLPAHLEAEWPPPFLKTRENRKERDEDQMLREGIRDLERLLRYEKRAWSRRRKAIRAFMAIKLNRRYHTERVDAVHGVPKRSPIKQQRCLCGRNHRL
jgi:hypothetical protein